MTRRKESPPVDPARSAQMALVRGKDTKPELRVRRALHAAGLRYRLQDKRLPGRPDLVFPSRRTVIFVHGCFWHRDPNPACPFTRTPKTRLEFWEGKFAENTARDARNEAALAADGWKVFVVWECETKDAARLARLVEEIRAEPEKPRRRQRKSRPAWSRKRFAERT
ncbi:very short patch repair endonuclease [Dankookia sp. GCM10030260]|uniref:very short patch repair endonuclease n=1 Tax=Dankookia sp. GCM10030260 TaxID=3273390 RepID=UPI00361AA463